MLSTKVKFGLIGLAVILMISGGFAYYRYAIKSKQTKQITAQPNIVSHEFDGTIGGADSFSSEGLLKVGGTFISKDHPEIEKVSKNITAKIDANTKFTKVVIHLPSVEELKKTKGYFDGRTLKRDTASSDLDSFKKDLSSPNFGINVYVTNPNENIYGKDLITAQEIKYEIAIQG